MNDKDAARIYGKLVRQLAGFRTPCLLWSAAITPAGYGEVWLQGKMRYTHIVVYEHEVGPVPVGNELDHLCPNTHCAESSHLEPVTHLENVRRGKATGRTSCPHGHKYMPENTGRSKEGWIFCWDCKRRRDSADYYARKARRHLQVAPRVTGGTRGQDNRTEVD